jgi:hypothetical protein
MSVEDNRHNNGEVEEVSTRENSTAEHRFDDLARGLANGTVSRGRALRLFGAALVGAALGSVPGVALAKPPPPGSGCKPQGAKCIVNRDCCSQNCFTQKGKMICGPVSGACFNNNDCASLPGQDACTKAVCDPAGVCVLEPVANCCLNAGQCPTPGDQCLKATCVNNVCVPAPDVGKSCNDNLRCTEGDTCNAAGECVGTAKTCTASTDPCKVNVCDPATGNCVSENAEDGIPCEDGDLCTLNDTCQGGTCKAGSPKSCPASTDPCKVNVCVPATGNCVSENAEDGIPCEDGDLCTLNDTCQGGTCRPGTAVDCSRLDTQCLEGVCDSQAGTCTVRNREDGTRCNADDNACTVNDTCQAGACVPGTLKTCPASTDPCKVNFCDPTTGNCATRNADNGTTCEDGDLCTVGDTCQNGQCQAGTKKTCTASTDPCKVNVCNPATGDCVSENAPNGTTCEDGDLCTLNDTCQGGTCQAGSKRTCPTCQTCSTAGICVPVTCSPTTNICCPTGPQAGTCGVALGATCTSTNNNCCAGTCKRNATQACRSGDTCTCRA